MVVSQSLFGDDFPSLSLSNSELNGNMLVRAVFASGFDARIWSY